LATHLTLNDLSWLLGVRNSDPGYEEARIAINSLLKEAANPKLERAADHLAGLGYGSGQHYGERYAAYLSKLKQERAKVLAKAGLPAVVE